MAYQFPQTYAPNYFQQQAAYNAQLAQAALQGTQVPTQPNMAQNGASAGLIWVQGESGAKSYLVGAGNTVLLMDSESQKFYIKTADASGMPMPLRVFEYKEVGGSETVDTTKYITREEFEKAIADLKGGERHE